MYVCVLEQEKIQQKECKFVALARDQVYTEDEIKEKSKI